MSSASATGLLVVCVWVSSSCALLPAARADASTVVWSSALVPCSPQLCGGVAANAATLRLNHGEVRVGKDGTLSIHLKGLSDAATGAILGGRTLEVWQGVFTTAGFEGGPVNPVGIITTDQAGDYEGSVHMNSGQPFALSDHAYSTQFALNNPSVRTEFVTGFRVQGARLPLKLSIRAFQGD